MQREVVVVGGVRTAIGKFGGSLRDQPPTVLGAFVACEVLARTGVQGRDVGQIMYRNDIATPSSQSKFSTS